VGMSRGIANPSLRRAKRTWASTIIAVGDGGPLELGLEAITGTGNVEV